MPKKIKTSTQEITPAETTVTQPISPSISMNFNSATDVLRVLDIAQYFAKKIAATIQENDYLIELLKFTNDATKSINFYLKSLEESAPAIEAEPIETVVLDEPKFEIVDAQ